MGGLVTLLIYGIIIIMAIKSNSSANAKNKKYEQAKKAYSKDCKEFDNITKLNDDKRYKNFIVQNDAIRSNARFDDGDEPIREYKGFFRRKSYNNFE